MAHDDDDLKADIAELAHQEQLTAALVAEQLRQSGLAVTEEVGGTGVVGLLAGTAGGEGTQRTLLVRADMDALPITEANEVEYVSRAAGKMHACGHDGHVAIALTLADLLMHRRDQLRGTVKFVFQPAEEQASGAAPMLADGVMRDPDVDAVIGLHLWSPTHVGNVAIQEGPFFASADAITLTVRGRGGHGAMPHQTVDPIAVAAQIVTAAQTLVSREISPLQPAVVTFGSIHGPCARTATRSARTCCGASASWRRASRAPCVRRSSTRCARARRPASTMPRSPTWCGGRRRRRSDRSICPAATSASP